MCVSSSGTLFALFSCACDANVQTWKDYRLMWNVSEYEGLDTIFMSVSDIWTPDVMLNNK